MFSSKRNSNKQGAFFRGAFSRGAFSRLSNNNINIIITAPDGAYAGAPLIITGGAYAIYADGEYILAVNDELPAVQVYQFVINGTPVGDWVTSPTTIPDSVVEGDLIQVADIAGNLSNTLVATDPINGGLMYHFDLLSYNSLILTYNP